MNRCVLSLVFGLLVFPAHAFADTIDCTVPAQIPYNDVPFAWAGQINSEEDLSLAFVQVELFGEQDDPMTSLPEQTEGSPLELASAPGQAKIWAWQVSLGVVQEGNTQRPTLEFDQDGRTYPVRFTLFRSETDATVLCSKVSKLVFERYDPPPFDDERTRCTHTHTPHAPIPMTLLVLCLVGLCHRRITS